MKRKKKQIRVRKIRVKRARKVVEKPFGDGTMSNSGFFGFIRSALRQKSRFFKSINNCRLNNRIPYKGPNKRRKWTYICQECKGEFDSKDVQVHHVIPVGTLTCFEDLPKFVENLFCNSDKLKLVCTKCHNKEHE